MRRIAAVAEYIFKQSFRNKILNILIIFAIFAIGFSLAISELAQEAEVKMVIDFGLFAISLFAFLTVVLSMTVQLFEETELKTLMLIMVKPIKRHEYIIGKYLGVVITVLMNILIMLSILMLIIKFRGGDPWDLKLILAAFYSFLSVCIISSVAMLLSVVTTSVPSCIIFLISTYAMGHLTIHLKNIADKVGGTIVKSIVDVIYYIVPNLELFNFKDKINSLNAVFEPSFMSLVLGYSLFYIIIMISIASIIFRKKEF